MRIIHFKNVLLPRLNHYFKTKQKVMIMKKIIFSAALFVAAIGFANAQSEGTATKDSANPPLTNVLTDSISQIVSACPGEIGVAVIVNNRDTVKVNNKSVYPMMSVFSNV